MDILIFILSIVFYLNRQKHFTLIGLLLLTTSYFGYGKNQATFPFIHNISDFGILLSVFLYFTRIHEVKKKSNTNEIKLFVLFGCFLIISSLFDVFVNKTSIIDIVKTNKSWLVLLNLFSFRNLEYKTIHKTIRLVILITIFQTLIYYIQYFSGIKIYEVHESTYDFAGKDINRGGFPPHFALLTFFFLIYNKTILRIKEYLRYLILILIFGTVILSVTRSVLISFLFGTFLLFFLDRLKAKNIAAFVFTFSLLFYILMQSKVMNDRFNKGIGDIQYAFNNNYKLANINENFSFRVFHFQERLDYICSSTYSFIFGLGYVHESSFNKKIFTIGLDSKDGAGIIQLDSGDFSWSVLLLRFGFLGLAIYLVFYFCFLAFFFKERMTPIARISFVYMFINIVVLSFVSSNISNGYYWPIIFLLYYLHKNQPKILVKNV